MARKISKWTWLGPLFVIIGAGLWGTETYFRVNLNSRYDSEVLVFIEHLFCIAFTLPFLFLRAKHLRRIPKRAWVYLFLSGSVGSAVGTTFFTLSLKVLNPSVANVLLNFQPVVSIAFAALLLNERLGKGFFLWSIFALACGLVIAANEFRFADVQWNIGLLYIAITAAAWGFSTVAGRGAMLHMPLGLATTGRFVIGGVSLFVSLVLKGKFNADYLKWYELGDPFVVENFILLSLGAGVVPLFFYFKGLSKTAASVAGFCELTQTFTALLLTWGIMHQALSAKQVVAGLLLVFAVYMINLNFAKANKGLKHAK